jgi:raffinose/stachyose/melibiose transport system permease protein
LNRVQSVVVMAVLLFWAAINLFPILVMLLSGFKTTAEIFMKPFGLPEKWSLANYVTAWKKASFAVYFRNSVLVSVVSITLIVLVSSMAAYVLARYRFPGKRLIYLYILAGLALPARLAVIPIFLLMRGIGLLNSLVGLFLVYTASGISFSTFLLTNFFRTVPMDLEDSGRIDGAGSFRLYWQINLPLLRPALATVAIFNFISVWNDFFFPLIFINSRDKRTIPLGIQAFFGEYSVQWDLLFAGLNIAIIPIIVFFLILSKQFISGLTEGAIR